MSESELTASQHLLSDFAWCAFVGEGFWMPELFLPHDVLRICERDLKGNDLSTCSAKLDMSGMRRSGRMDRFDVHKLAL
jgi:hypothetical protein